MGGDHKCPLCSATFTRPQHVGRHLRAHTGDRPYECRDCPLRFARSDLLSRHVNKAHARPTEGGEPSAPPKKTTKKGRRKSMPNIGAVVDTEESGREDTAQREYSQPEYRQTSTTTGQAESRPNTQQNTQSHFQAQRMYPHHPLLANNINTANGQTNDAWNTIPNASSATGYQPFLENGAIGNQMYIPGTGFVPPFATAPMRNTGSDGSSGTGYNGFYQNQLAGMGYEMGYKKRACDQCNHSKVRCDFAEPCARCAHRSLACTYHKPQRARTVAYPIASVPNQIPRQFQSPTSTSVFAPNIALSTTSSSPQSHFSSPNSSGSPAIVNSQTLAALGPAFDRRRNSIATLSPNYSTPPVQARPILTTEALPWGRAYTPAGMTSTQNANEAWQSQMAGMQGSADLSNSVAGYIPLQTQPRRTSGASGNFNSGMYAPKQGGSNDSSPQQHLAPTPSLTNNTTSPAGSDEPPERRTGSSGPTYAWPEANQDPSQAIKPAVYPLDQSYQIPMTYSASSSPFDPNVNPIFQQDSFNSTTNYGWTPNSGTIDPRYGQFQQTLVSDDEDASGPGSSAASTFLDMDEAAMLAVDNRRRSSAGTGIWANAFNQMSIQDQGNAAAANGGNGGPNGTMMTDPFTASQIAQDDHSRRPTFPLYSHNGVQIDGSGNENGRLSSLSDVKDIWKMFMAEPMTSGLSNIGMGMTGGTGTTPLLEKTNEFDGSSGSSVVPLLTPRPGLGRRTLSKSNSLPDLTSPMVQGPAFFSNYLNGITPKASAADNTQTSYIPSQQPSGTDGKIQSGQVGANDGIQDPALLKKWKNEIQQRQTNFQMHLGEKVKSGSTVDKHTSPPTATRNQGTIPTMLPPQMIHPNSGRPLASVLQQSSALQQTLAPERTPSFGLSNPYPDSTLSSNISTFQKTPSRLSHGVAPAIARPGNKRLASQTLGPELQKKGTFELWDDGDDDGVLGDAEDDEGGKGMGVGHKSNSAVGAATAGNTGIGGGGGAQYVSQNQGAGFYSTPTTTTNSMPEGNGLQGHGGIYYSTWPPVHQTPSLTGLDEGRKGL